jgi:outer membrane protein OmpA-like peptidoglycan-associated protein
LKNPLSIPLLLALALGFLSAKVQSQEVVDVYLDSTSVEEFSYGNSELFNFENINKVPYYFNAKAIRKIRHYDEKQDWDKLYPLLKNYVASFGIENFYKSTYWLWRLAKLTELFGDQDEARLLYNLALKHYRNNLDVNKIELYYDSLTQNTKDYYVPIEYYYELVNYRQLVDTLRPPRGMLLNMGHKINSPHADYGPSLNKDDNLLIFTSKRDFSKNPMDTEPIENLYYSIKDGNMWLRAKPLEGINTDLNEGSAILSKDGKTIYFSRCEDIETFGGCDIYKAKMQEDSTWSSFLNIGPNINSTGWDSHPALSQTDDTLFFASDRIGGFGLADIYYAVKDDKGEWQESVNAGPIINTRQNEVSPFYHPKEDVLYYSSNGLLLNFGEFDIYKTFARSGNWVEPKNIGPLVNGPGSEFYFTIDGKSEQLYYARSAENNLDNLDLYSFPLPMEAQPRATTLLSGQINNDSTGNPMQGIVSIIDLDNGIEVAAKFLRPNGTFEFELINNNNYLIIVQGESYFRLAEIFKLEDDTQISASVKPLSTKIKFESIVFGNGESTLTPEMYDDLDKIVDFLLDNPDFNLRINGHTDSDGREDFNLALSQERSDSILEYIVFFGNVNVERITAKGYGSSRPILTYYSERAKKLNRRVEFELYRE